MAASIFEIPTHGQIYREKSGGSMAVEDGYDAKLLTWRDSALQQGMSEARDNPEYDCIASYLDYIEGRQGGTQSRASWLSRFIDNRMSKARIDALAYLTDIKPTISVTTHVKAYVDAAKVIQSVIQKEWKDRRMDSALEEVLDHALLGTGYWKVGCSYPGEFSILACGIDTVIPVQQGKDIQDSTAIIYRAFKPPQFFKERWPMRAQGIEKEADATLLRTDSNFQARPWTVSEYSWNSMSPSMRYHKSMRNPGSSAQDQWADFPLIEYQEIWIDDWHVNEYSYDVIVKDPYKDLESHNYWYIVRPGERLYPRKRLLVFGGDRLMYDGPSPYWHGLYPFAKLRLNPVIWSSGGLSMYRDLVPLQDSLNRIGAGVENVVEKAIRPIVITKDGAVPATSWEKFFTDRPGSKLKLTPLGNPATDVRFIDPPVLPGYVEQQRQYIQSAFKEQSGQIDMGSLAKKKQLPGGDTVEQFKDSMTAPRRRELRNVEIFLEDAGKLAVPCVAQFFSRNRRLQMLGGEGLTKSDFDYKPGTMYSWAGLPEEFAKNFALEIEQGSLHAGSKDRARQIAMVLRKTHDISRRELWRQLDIGNADQIEEELKAEGPVGPAPKGKAHTEMTRGQKNGASV